MKRRNQDDTKKPGKSDKVGDLLKKLRQLDQNQLEDVNGGMARCGSRCCCEC